MQEDGSRLAQEEGLLLVQEKYVVDVQAEDHSNVPSKSVKVLYCLWIVCESLLNSVNGPCNSFNIS